MCVWYECACGHVESPIGFDAPSRKKCDAPGCGNEMERVWDEDVDFKMQKPSSSFRSLDVSVMEYEDYEAACLAMGHDGDDRF